jgi:hypothetical protein
LTLAAGVWLVRDPGQDGEPVGVVVERGGFAGSGIYDVAELDGDECWVGQGHATVAAAVADLTAFLAGPGL